MFSRNRRSKISSIVFPSFAHRPEPRPLWRIIALSDWLTMKSTFSETLVGRRGGLIISNPNYNNSTTSIHLHEIVRTAEGRERVVDGESNGYKARPDP